MMGGESNMKLRSLAWYDTWNELKHDDIKGISFQHFQHFIASKKCLAAEVTYNVQPFHFYHFNWSQLVPLFTKLFIIRGPTSPFLS